MARCRTPGPRGDNQDEGDTVIRHVTDYKGAWHGDPELKAEVMARMLAHRAADTIIQGLYQQVAPELATGYKGCLVGCTLPLQPILSPLGPDPYPPDGNWHGEVQRLYGIPYYVAEVLDHAFESLTRFDDAAGFAVDSIEAIPVGADLRGFVCFCRGYSVGCGTYPPASSLIPMLRNAPLISEEWIA